MLKFPRRAAVVVLSVASVAGLAACSSDSGSKSSTTTAATTPKADVVVTKDSYSKPQTLTVGQKMDVEVSAPTGTNYSWSVREGYDTLVVSQDGAPVVTPTKEGMPGAPAVTTFRFTAIGAGKTDVWIDLRDNATGSAAQAVRVPVTVTA